MSARRGLALAADAWIERVGDAQYELDVGSTAPEVLAAELQLLASGWVASVSLRHAESSLEVKLTRGGGAVRATAERAGDVLVLALSDAELGAWIGWFLRAYRDGEPEVDHLDVEARDRAGAVVDLCLRAG